MSPIQFLPAAAAAVAPLVERITDRALENLSFKQLLSVDDGGAGDSPPTSNSVPDSGGPPGAGSDVLRSQAARELKAFVAELQKRLSDRGIDSNDSFELSLRPGGEVIVDGNHPQRGGIEELFRTDPGLTRDFQRLTAAMTAHARQQDPELTRDRDFRLELVDGSFPNARFV